MIDCRIQLWIQRDEAMPFAIVFKEFGQMPTYSVTNFVLINFQTPHKIIEFF